MNRLPLWRGLFLISLAMACFGLAQMSQAVTPAPDGFYPGFNTAEGQNALLHLSGGIWNTALGGQALLNDTTGTGNTAVGLNALYHNTSGDSNTAVGVNALLFNTTGIRNVAVGQGALASNSQNNNVAVGFQALGSNTTAVEQVAVGHAASSSIISQGFSVAVGFQALDDATGGQNTAVGDNALGGVSTGTLNTALGDLAGASITTGTGNVDIGAFIFGGAESNITRIKNIGNTLQNSGIYVTLDSVGGTKLGYVNLSSRRYKDDIKPMDKVSEAIYSLQPVTFRFKKEYDPKHGPGFGLIAEEVAKINPELVSYNDKGEVMTVHYDYVNAMMLNEFLKEHRKVEGLEATVAQHEVDFDATIGQQEKELAALSDTLKEQAEQIQKVSARIDATKPVPQVVANH